MDNVQDNVRGLGALKKRVIISTTLYLDLINLFSQLFKTIFFKYQLNQQKDIFGKIQ